MKKFMIPTVAWKTILLNYNYSLKGNRGVMSKSQYFGMGRDVILEKAAELLEEVKELRKQSIF